LEDNTGARTSFAKLRKLLIRRSTTQSADFTMANDGAFSTYWQFKAALIRPFRISSTICR
jgi:hypothetical protein